MFHAFGNNPITYTDPDGRADYIYSIDEDGNKQYTVENDWGIFEFIHPDRYFVESIDGERYRANSRETVEMASCKKIDLDFLDGKFIELINTANQKKTDFIRIWNESVGGELDFKQFLDDETLYFDGKVLYNRNEMGNFIWAYFLQSNGYGELHGILAQGGSLLGNQHRFDEIHDMWARYAGVRYSTEQKFNRWLKK